VLDGVVDPVDDRHETRVVGNRTRSLRPPAGSLAPRRPPRRPGIEHVAQAVSEKLNASTTVKIASRGTSPSTTTGSTGAVATSIPPPSAAGRRDRETRGPREQDRACEVECREHHHRAGDVRENVPEQRTPRRGAHQPCGLHVPESPTERTRPRTTRAYDGQATTTIASAAF
jgi:hypothetical protein